jgi:tetratricopeptide (TPR) repeat protein
VHSLTRSSLPLRETSDFQTYEDVARKLLAVAASAEPIEKFSLQQEANRCLSEARKFNDLVNMEFADYDAIVESCAGLIRSKQPRFDLAAARLAEVLKRDPSNADAHLLKLELMRRSDTKAEVAQEAIQAALDLAAVPEIYHEAVGFYLARNARNKAIKVLEGAIEAMPEISRLRTRLASLLLRQGRRPEAIEHLRTAMEQDPMLPDAYGLLGMARREEGAEKLDEAETLLREAVRLAPRDVVQTSRLVWLLLDIARGVPERAPQVREEVRGLLDNLLQHDKKSWEAHLLYAVALREEGEEQLERARWFLKQARKLAPPKGGPAIRFDVEDAMLELAAGQLDEAEARLRRLEKRDPTNHRVFGALAQVLVRRGQLFAAHAELVRAADRTSPNSLDRQAYDMELARLRGLIQEQAGVELPEPTQTPLEEVQVATDVLGLEEDAVDGGDGAEGAPPAEES